MRRWFEFGSDGYTNGPFYLRSERNNGRGAPFYVSMQHKEQVFSILQATLSSRPVRILYLQDLDQGVDPAPDCPAFHIPRQFSVTATNGLYASLPFLAFGGWPLHPNGNFSGLYASPLFLPASAPPDENGN